MEKEFNLSEKRFDDTARGFGFYQEDVKEFIKKLKDQFVPNKRHTELTRQIAEIVLETINKLAGEKLI